MTAWLSPADVNMVAGYLDLAGVLICGLLGGAVARAEGLDLFGYLVVGTVSGLGGGIIRDTLLQRGTPVALTDAAYLPTAFAGAFLAFVIAIGEEHWHRLFTALDAAVLGFWAISGAQKTLAAGLAWLPAVLVGTVTAVGGGAVRDLLLTRIPAVLGGNGLYATVAVVVSGLYIVCAHFRIPTLGIVGGVLGAVLLRLVANRRGWSLPGGLPLEPSRALARMRRRSKGGRPSDPPEEFPHDRRD
ncbi:trimeric intracellular cation channel family protein [Streptomyces sp. S465]|uniref:trimeric intracellular cation channel family protein n=1 Tax=Streptomyces sp. S465 TaxID=2979468 RepID=UPI0022A882EB|nr:trimeric intracellular cation channel family protein [Streptomyces sp. S465]WAP53697.1 trimeric intracellular cation channel family protein [Streptomyces sp. S465]